MNNNFVEYEEVAESVHHICDICGKCCSSIKSTIKKNCAGGGVGGGEGGIDHLTARCTHRAVSIKISKCYKSYICVYT